MHKFKLKQRVVLARPAREGPEIYEVIHLRPVLPNGEPQYRIKGRESGIERAVREAEIRPYFE